MGLNFTKACVVLASTLVGVNAFATDFTYNGVHYNITSTDDATTKTVEVIPLSDGAKYVGDATGKLTIPSTAKDESGNSYTVTAIAANAFKGCDEIKSFDIAYKVQTIGAYAFEGCKSIVEIKLSSGITTIGQYAFKDCTGLKYVTTTNKLKSFTLQNNCFDGCTSLYSTAFNASAFKVGADVYNNCANFRVLQLSNATPDNLTLDENALRGADPSKIIIWCDATLYKNEMFTSKGIKWWCLPTKISGVTGAMAFNIEDDSAPAIIEQVASCSAFEFPENYTYEGKTWKVTEVDDKAFKSNSNLKELTIPSSIKKIGAAAFNLASSLSTITFAEREESNQLDIAPNAFCAGYKVINVESNLNLVDNNENAEKYFIGLQNAVLYGSSDFVNSVANNDRWQKSFLVIADKADDAVFVKSTDGIGLALAHTTKTGDVVIPDEVNGQKVVEIRADAFKSATTSVTSLTLPKSINKIWPTALDGLTKMTTLDLSKTELKSFTYNLRGLASMTEVKFPETLEELGDEVFWSNSGIKTFKMPASVKKIGKGIFRTSKVESVDLSEMKIRNLPIETFYNCSKLTKVILPENLDSIDHRAFRACVALKNIELPANTKYIGNLAFYGSGVESIEFPATVWALTSECFMNCKSLEKVKINGGDKMRSISFSYGAFQNCEKLASIEVGENIQFGINTKGYNPNGDGTLIDYGYNHFDGIPANCKVIAHAQNVEEYFSKEPWTGFKSWNIDGLDLEKDAEGKFTAAFVMPTVAEDEKVEVVIPEGTVTVLTSDTGFAGKAIDDVKLGEGVEVIGEGTFKDCKSLETVELPTTMTELGLSAFSGCTSLQTIEVPGNVTTIGAYAFDGCTAMTDAVLPASVSSVGAGAFKNCEALKKVAFSSEKKEEASQSVKARAPRKALAVKTIDSEAFVGTGLKTIEISETDPAKFTAADDAFVASDATEEQKKAVYDNITLVVPNDKAKTAYSEASVWKNFSNIKTESEFKNYLDIDEVATEAAEVSASNGAIDVTGVADGTVVEVFAVNGAKVATGTVESGALQVSVDVAGIYVVRVDGKSFKVVLR